MNQKSKRKKDRRRGFPVLLSVLMLAAAVLVCGMLVVLRLRQSSETHSDSAPASAAESVSASDLPEAEPNASAEPDATEITVSAVADSPVSVPAAEEVFQETAESPAEPEASPSDKPAIDIRSWEFLLANSYNGIGGYEPPYESYQDQGIDERIRDAADAFLAAARNNGFNAFYSTIYRNYDYQDQHFSVYYMNRAGEDPIKAVDNYLPPGFSDHQTGLSVDFTDQAGYSALYEDFDDSYMEDTDLYRWAVENCAEYGFVLRYPPGKEAYYGTPCSHPAHFRYVGKEAAKYMTEHDLCLEEFIMLYDESLVYIPAP